MQQVTGMQRGHRGHAGTETKAAEELMAEAHCGSSSISVTWQISAKQRKQEVLHSSACNDGLAVKGREECLHAEFPW